MKVNEYGELVGVLAILSEDDVLDIYYKKLSDLKQYINVVSDFDAEDTNSDYVHAVVVRDLRELLAMISDKSFKESHISTLAHVILHTRRVPKHHEMIELIEML
jgi:Asp-tRNA(Asn)/Glu-tRNA(Gln) amidotransferase C subunit